MGCVRCFPPATQMDCWSLLSLYKWLTGTQRRQEELAALRAKNKYVCLLSSPSRATHQ